MDHLCCIDTPFSTCGPSSPRRGVGPAAAEQVVHPVSELTDLAQPLLEFGLGRMASRQGSRRQRTNAGQGLAEVMQHSRQGGSAHRTVLLDVTPVARPRVIELIF